MAWKSHFMRFSNINMSSHRGAPPPATARQHRREAPPLRGGGTSAADSAEAVVPRQRGSGGDNRGQQSLSPSMTRFSLLQIDVEDLEDLETSENQTSFEIHNIVWRRTHLLAVIIYIIRYRYLCKVWYHWDIELQDSRRSTPSVLEYLQKTANKT